MRSRTEILLKLIAANVRRFRLDRGLTQEGLAERAGYDVRMVQYVEAGQRNLTVDSIVAFADALEVVPSKLLETTWGGAPLDTRDIRER